jgi:hypothetical protein
MRVLIKLIPALMVLTAGCSEAPPPRPTATTTCPDGSIAPGLSGLSLLDPEAEGGRAATLECLIFIADQTWAKAPLEYGEAHFRWHAFAVLDERRTAEGLVEAAGALYWSQAQDAVRWLGMVMGHGAWRAEDDYGCPVAPEALGPALEAARPDPLSDMCERLTRLQPDPSDPAAMAAAAPFVGACPDRERYGLKRLQLLPARAAVKAHGDQVAFGCLLDDVRGALDSDAIPLPDQLAIFMAARRLGLLAPGEWETVTARIENGVDPENLPYWYAEAEAAAEREYAAVN